MSLNTTGAQSFCPYEPLTSLLGLNRNKVGTGWNQANHFIADMEPAHKPTTDSWVAVNITYECKTQITFVTVKGDLRTDPEQDSYVSGWKHHYLQMLEKH